MRGRRGWVRKRLKHRAKIFLPMCHQGYCDAELWVGSGRYTAIRETALCGNPFGSRRYFRLRRRSPGRWAFPPREPKKYRRRWLQSLNAGGRENPWPRGRLRRTAERGSSDDRRRRSVYPRPNPQAVFLNFPYDLKFRKLYLGYIAGVCSSGLAPRATLWQPSSFWPAPSRSARIGTCTASSPSASSRRSTELWMA